MNTNIDQYLAVIGKRLWLRKTAREAALTEMRAHLETLEKDGARLVDPADIERRFGNPRTLADEINASAPWRRLHHLRMLGFAATITAGMWLPLLAIQIFNQFDFNSPYSTAVLIACSVLLPILLLKKAISAGIPSIGTVGLVLAPPLSLLTVILPLVPYRLLDAVPLTSAAKWGMLIFAFGISVLLPATVLAISAFFMKRHHTAG